MKILQREHNTAQHDVKYLKLLRGRKTFLKVIFEKERMRMRCMTLTQCFWWHLRSWIDKYFEVFQFRSNSSTTKTSHQHFSRFCWFVICTAQTQFWSQLQLTNSINFNLLIVVTHNFNLIPSRQTYDGIANGEICLFLSKQFLKFREDTIQVIKERCRYRMPNSDESKLCNANYNAFECVRTITKWNCYHEGENTFRYW